MLPRLKRRLGRSVDALIERSRLRAPISCVALSTPAALSRIAKRGLDIATVIDVGASDGRWSLDALRFWPRARYHLIEANRCHEAALAALCRHKPGFSFALAAAGDREGEIFFDGRDPWGGVASHKRGENLVTVPGRTISGEVERNGLRSPFLIKLDTHGFEIPILEGARSLFPQVNLFVIEAYAFTLRPGSLKFHELCAWMSERGFEVIDLSEPLWREKDRALWQFDLFFVPGGRQEFACDSYR
jgi:FkbM family methyltransferase